MPSPHLSTPAPTSHQATPTPTSHQTHLPFSPTAAHDALWAATIALRGVDPTARAVFTVFAGHTDPYGTSTLTREMVRTLVGVDRDEAITKARDRFLAALTTNGYPNLVSVEAVLGKSSIYRFDLPQLAQIARTARDAVRVATPRPTQNPSPDDPTHPPGPGPLGNSPLPATSSPGNPGVPGPLPLDHSTRSPGPHHPNGRSLPVYDSSPIETPPPPPPNAGVGTHDVVVSKETTVHPDPNQVLATLVQLGVSSRVAVGLIRANIDRCAAVAAAGPFVGAHSPGWYVEMCRHPERPLPHAVPPPMPGELGATESSPALAVIGAVPDAAFDIDFDVEVARLAGVLGLDTASIDLVRAEVETELRSRYGIGRLPLDLWNATVAGNLVEQLRALAGED